MEGWKLTTSARQLFTAAGLTAAIVVGGASAAAAQDYPNQSPPASVQGTENTRGGQVASEVGSQSVGSLAVTGADVAGLTAIGAGAIAAGAVLVRRGRRRTS